MGEGYYTIEDGSGRRSDTMTAEEWQDAITTPAMKTALRDMKATDGSGAEYTQRIAAERLLDRAKVIFEGGTEADADKAQHKKDYEKGLATPCKWHYYEPPGGPQPKRNLMWGFYFFFLLFFLRGGGGGGRDNFREEPFLSYYSRYREALPYRKRPAPAAPS